MSDEKKNGNGKGKLDGQFDKMQAELENHSSVMELFSQGAVTINSKKEQHLIVIDLLQFRAGSIKGDVHNERWVFNDQPFATLDAAWTVVLASAKPAAAAPAPAESVAEDPNEDPEGTDEDDDDDSSFDFAKIVDVEGKTTVAAGVTILGDICMAESEIIPGEKVPAQPSVTKYRKVYGTTMETFLKFAKKNKVEINKADFAAPAGKSMKDVLAEASLSEEMIKEVLDVIEVLTEDEYTVAFSKADLHKHADFALVISNSDGKVVRTIFHNPNPETKPWFCLDADGDPTKVRKLEKLIVELVDPEDDEDEDAEDASGDDSDDDEDDEDSDDDEDSEDDDDDEDSDDDDDDDDEDSDDDDDEDDEDSDDDEDDDEDEKPKKKVKRAKTSRSRSIVKKHAKKPTKKNKKHRK